MTDAERVAEIRERLSKAIAGMVMTRDEAKSIVKLFLRELDRVTRERDALSGQLCGLADTIDALKYENARLTRERDEAQDQAPTSA